MRAVAQDAGGTNRLIVSFADAQKTVKSSVPAVLWDYLDEVGLTSSSIRIVSFQDAGVLAEVRRFIEAQPGEGGHEGAGSAPRMCITPLNRGHSLKRTS